MNQISRQVINVLREHPTWTKKRVQDKVGGEVKSWHMQSARRKLKLGSYADKPKVKRKKVVRKKRRVTNTIGVGPETMSAAELIIQVEQLAQRAGNLERLQRAIDVLSQVGDI